MEDIHCMKQNYYYAEASRCGGIRKLGSGSGYGHITPKTAWGQVATIIYAIIGIPLTLLTITNLGGFMATMFRYVYRNVCCTLCCLCCRRRPQTDDELETETGNRNPPETKAVTCWSTLRQILVNTEDIRSVQVPITVSLILVVSYLAVGALLFTLWERDWNYLIGFYFCFVTLSTIGFGDYVPGTSLDAWASQAKLVLCALYLLVGLALLAMCFDLMQEQAKRQLRDFGRRLRLISRQE